MPDIGQREDDGPKGGPDAQVLPGLRVGQSHEHQRDVIGEQGDKDGGDHEVEHENTLTIN